MIAKVISLVAYQLDLPPTWRIHLVFHVSNLKRFHWSEEFKRVERPPSPIVIDGEEESEVETILRHKGTGAWHLYQVLEDCMRHVATTIGSQQRRNCGAWQVD